jgi:hypothetical protein
MSVRRSFSAQFLGMLCHKLFVCCEKSVEWYIAQEQGFQGGLKVLICVQFLKRRTCCQFESKIGAHQVQGFLLEHFKIISM